MTGELRQISANSTDSADAARWRLFCYVTGWTGGAHEAGVRWNEREAQLAQYGANEARLRKALTAMVNRLESQLAEAA
jgi:hypothetical protein